MKAAVYSKRPAGKFLEFVEIGIPTPKENEVLIKVCATSINPLDWRMKAARPGVDVAGQVERVGSNVTKFKTGDAVFGAAKGAFAHHAVGKESDLALKPDNITFEQAASVPIAGLTALQGLRDVGHLKSEQKVLINGAAGGVGTFAVQIAKGFGAHVTGVCSAGNVAQTLALGADRAIDYASRDFTTGEERYDLLLDNVGDRPLSDLRHVLTPRGRCVLVGAQKKLWPILMRVLKALLLSPFQRQKFIFFIAKVRPADLIILGELMQSGKVKPAIDHVYRFEEIADAIAYVEKGHARSKVVVSL
jgi:NADPH:quinone reductase-like Zn-dependent oxidoreductase